jgi:alpha/beta superfamily hydrolase
MGQRVACTLADVPADVTLVAKTYWAGVPFWFRKPPDGARVQSLALRTADFRQIRALHWAPSTGTPPRVGVVVIHPRVDFTHHYTVPRLVAAGFSVLAANSRHVNNDIPCEHEGLVLDVAACVRWLREKGDAQRVILLGNSGGGSLVAFYQAQARLPPAARLERSPGGTPTRFGSLDMTPADGLALVAAHRGQGHVLLRSIDAAVVDEGAAFTSDQDLDVYDARNGFREPPTPTTYDPGFVARVRAAQAERVRRIDEVARGLLAERARAADEAEQPGFEARPFDVRQQVLRRRSYEPVMSVLRTMANPAYVDPSIDADPEGATREYGSLMSDRPDLMNMTAMGFARLCTPRAWLSTWSGLSSNADLLVNVPRIEEPTLVVHATRDRELYFDRDARPVFEASASRDKKLVRIEGARHYFEPDFGEKAAPDVERLMDVLVPWMKERFA